VAGSPCTSAEQPHRQAEGKLVSITRSPSVASGSRKWRRDEITASRRRPVEPVPQSSARRHEIGQLPLGPRLRHFAVGFQENRLTTTPSAAASRPFNAAHGPFDPIKPAPPVHQATCSSLPLICAVASFAPVPARQGKLGFAGSSGGLALPVAAERLPTGASIDRISAPVKS